MAACSQVLESPELLICILRHLEDQKPPSGLVAATRVNQAWFDIATEMLWRRPDMRPSTKSQIPRCEALARIKRARRQIYASKITVLDFRTKSDFTSHELFAGLEFPRLKELTLTGFDAQRDSFILVPPLLQYIQPSLEALTVVDWNQTFPKQFLDLIATNCLRLKSIDVKHDAGDHILPADFVDFCSLIAQTLQSVDLGYHSGSSTLIDSLVIEFSRMKMLKSLKIANECRPSAFESIKRLNPDPFPNLIELCLRIWSQDIPSVAEIVPNVKLLELDILNSGPVFFNHVAAMSQLRELNLWVCGGPSTTAKDSLALRSLHQLRTLSLVIEDLDEGTDADRMTDEEFGHLISGFPNMTSLHMNIDFKDCSTAIFFSISDFCPQLEFLDLDGVFNIESLQSRPPSMFPVLKSLFLHGLWPPGIRPQLTPLQVARLIDNHAPQLEIFRDQGGIGHSEVADIWRKTYRSP